MHHELGAGFRQYLLFILVLILGIPTPAPATAAGNEPKTPSSVASNCRQNGPILVCALRAAISADSRSGQNLSIRASLSLEITNNGELPVVLFGPAGEPVAFQPDKGPEIAGAPQIRGMPQCNSTPQSCLANNAFVPLRLAPHSTATAGLNIQQWISRENVARIALAGTAVFSGRIYLVDGNEQLSSISISLPILGLDNGLGGM